LQRVFASPRGPLLLLRMLLGRRALRWGDRSAASCGRVGQETFVRRRSTSLRLLQPLLLPMKIVLDLRHAGKLLLLLSLLLSLLMLMLLMLLMLLLAVADLLLYLLLLLVGDLGGLLEDARVDGAGGRGGDEGVDVFVARVPSSRPLLLDHGRLGGGGAVVRS